MLNLERFKKVLQIITIVFFLSFIAAIFVFSLSRSSFLPFFLLLSLLILTIKAIKNNINKYKTKMQKEILILSLSYLGKFYQEQEIITEKLIRESNTCEPFELFEIYFSFSGYLANMPLSVLKTKLNREDTSEDETYTVFDGTFIAIQMDKKIKAPIFVLNYPPKKKIPLSKNFTKIKIQDDEFMQNFRVFSSNSLDVYSVLTHDFTEKLKKLKFICNTKRIHVAFLENIVLFTIDTSPIFDIFKLDRAIKHTDNFIKFYDQIAALEQIIMTLKKN